MPILCSFNKYQCLKIIVFPWALFVPFNNECWHKISDGFVHNTVEFTVWSRSTYSNSDLPWNNSVKFMLAMRVLKPMQLALLKFIRNCSVYSMLFESCHSRVTKIGGWYKEAFVKSLMKNKLSNLSLMLRIWFTWWTPILIILVKKSAENEGSKTVGRQTSLFTPFINHWIFELTQTYSKFPAPKISTCLLENISLLGAKNSASKKLAFNLASGRMMKL